MRKKIIEYRSPLPAGMELFPLTQELVGRRLQFLRCVQAQLFGPDTEATKEVERGWSGGGPNESSTMQNFKT